MSEQATAAATADGDVTAAAIDRLVDELRAIAAQSVATAVARVDAVLARGDAHPALLYLAAELGDRQGRSHDALALIVAAQDGYRRLGLHLEAERCEIGRVSVLEDLGRHDEGIQAATAQLRRLAVLPHDDTVIGLTVRTLSNRALCLETLGRYTEALEDYDEACGLAGDIDDELLASQLQINRSNVLDLLGRTEEAVDGLRAAHEVLVRAGEREDQVKVAANIGAVLCRRGEYDDGLRWFGRAEELVEPGTSDECAIQIETGEALAGLGAFDEAVNRYQKALAALAGSTQAWLEGRAWLGLGLCRSRLDEPDSARESLRTALDAFQAAGNLPSQVTALLELAAIEGDEIAQSAALDQARQALKLADAHVWPVQACIAHITMADLVDGHEAERHLRAALEIATQIGLAPVLMRAQQRLGALLLRRGRPHDAAPHIEAAVAIADSLRGRLRHGRLLRSFPTETSSCHRDLVEVRLSPGDIPAAFDAADAARNRSLVDLGLGALDGRPDGRETTRLEAELHAVYDRLLGFDETLDRSRRCELEDRARDLETRLDHDEFGLWPSTPAAGTVDVPTTIEDDSDLTLVYHAVDDEIGVFVRRAGGRISWHPSIASVAEVAAELSRFHADGRRALALRRAGVAATGPWAEGVQRRLEALGESLLGPVAEEISTTATGRAARIAISPVGVLHGVPFAALALGAGGPSLIDLAVVTLAPSVALRRSCLGRRPASDASVLVGVSSGGVPGAAREVRALAKVLPEAVVLLDDAATLDSVEATSREAATVHVASHGLFRPSAPLRSGVRLADGWLTATAASRLRIEGALVVLSACDTARATIADGDEILGLQYGFFAAGARTVVMSLWPAHDATTVDLMLGLHESRGHGDAAAVALRHAQLRLRAREPHPWMWAAFVAAGA